MDDRLEAQELKLGKNSESLTKICEVNAQNCVNMYLRIGRMEARMDNVDSTLGELKDLILGLHSSPREGEGATNSTGVQAV